MPKAYRKLEDIPADLLEIWKTAVVQDELVLPMPDVATAQALQNRLYEVRRALRKLSYQLIEQIEELEISRRKNILTLKRPAWLLASRQAIRRA